MGSTGTGTPDTQRRRARVAATTAALGSMWAILHGIGLIGAAADITFLALAGVAIVATAVGMRWNQPQPRWPWLSIAAAMVLFLAGGAAREALQTLGNLTASRSLVPDLVTLPGYLLLGTGLIGMARAGQHGRLADFDAILDGVVAALAALTLAWVAFINPVLFHEHAPLPVRIVLATYPPMSVFMVAIAARIAFSARARRTPAFRLLLAAMGFMLLGDTVYMLVDGNLAHIPQRLVDMPYAFAYVAFSAAVLHPSLRGRREVVDASDTRPSRPRLAIVTGALGIPAVVTVARQSGAFGDRAALSAIILGLTGMATWRVFRALRSHADAQALLRHQATHDLLTGLPNRAHLREHIARELKVTAEHGGCFAVVFLDVDRFKLVNDSLGHSLGDELLVAVAARLRGVVGSSGLVCRIGGDEFVVACGGLEGERQAVSIAERIRASFRTPFSVRDSEIFASASLGVACTDALDPTVDAEVLIRDADTAMYQAKSRGRDGVALFDVSMRDRVAERLALERELRHASERNQLELHYQPIVRLADGQVEGIEALLRWSHPTMGQVPPSKFIPVAEDTGIITDIGNWVIEDACRRLAHWRREIPGFAEAHVAVNLSARQLRDPHLVSTASTALARNGLGPGSLWLEITESLLMDNPRAAAEVLAELRAIGIGLSIDDFGTGYSSLAYLKRFPVDRVKIDRSFVDGLDEPRASDRDLVRAIIAMAGALGISTIAEGVERSVQEHLLTRLGCERAQGYLYSRPLPPSQLPGAVAGIAAVAGTSISPR